MPELVEQLLDARRMTDELFARLHRDRLYDRPIPARHRWVFYIGHVEAFDCNQIGRFEAGLAAVHERFDKLFEFGIDPGPTGLPEDHAEDWPALDEVFSYARAARDAVDAVAPSASAERLAIAIEHRLMHVETLAYMLHQMPYDAKSGPAPQVERSQSGTREAVRVPAGVATLGRRRGGGFGWDNEFERHEVRVPAFEVDRCKVSNEEWVRFVAAGGPAPPFWVRRDREWRLRAGFAEIDMPGDWPVYVMREQAAAYAAWSGCRLPTEAEYARYSEGAQPVNCGCERWDPVGVKSTPQGDSAWGAAQTVGNGWEWMSDVFAPFAGFRPTPGYEGYSANFFDGEHYVLKGASPMTPMRLVRPTFRNWFRGDYPYVFATFRTVRDVA